MPILVGCPDNAFFTLKPKNAAALLAFTEVVDHILQEQQHSDLQERVARIAQFLWLDSNEKVELKPVAQLMSRRLNTMPGSSSPLSSIDGETGMFIWTGGYFFNLEKSLSAGWTLGWYSSRLSADLVLIMDRQTSVSRIHTSLRVNNTTRLAYLASHRPNLVSVNSESATTGPLYRLGLPSASNKLDIGGLQFEFSYTNFSQTEQVKVILRDYLACVYGADSQAPSETISATPTPGSTTSTLGQYTLYGALGAGSYGSVRPAVSRSGDEIFAIKTIISRRNLASELILTMRRITELLDSSPGKGNVLRLIESFEIPGAMDEIHLVLSPFTPITLEKLPVQTRKHNSEIIFRDCLRGLNFLHQGNFIHSDVKPANIGLQLSGETLLTSYPTPHPFKAVLLDIDSAQPLALGSSRAAAPGHGGTPGYLSPERERTSYNHTEDIWALGVTACYVLLGIRPFQDSQGNPWREDAADKVTRRERFHSQYETTLERITEFHTSSAIRRMIFNALRFEEAKYSGQSFPRYTGNQLLQDLVRGSDILSEWDE